MAVLDWMSVAGVAFIAGCYAPELRDCAVSCASSADCAPSHVCGSDRMCAAPELAGRCAGGMDVTDASSDSSVDAPTTIAADAALPDAAASIDAAPQRLVRIEIAGRGSVNVAGSGICAHNSMPHPCTLSVTAGIVASLQATAAPQWIFEKWESGPCLGQGGTCTFIPMQALTDVKVQFKQSDGD